MFYLGESYISEYIEIANIDIKSYLNNQFIEKHSFKSTSRLFNFK